MHTCKNTACGTELLPDDQHDVCDFCYTFGPPDANVAPLLKPLAEDCLACGKSLGGELDTWACSIACREALNAEVQPDEPDDSYDWAYPERYTRSW